MIRATLPGSSVILPGRLQEPSAPAIPHRKARLQRQIEQVRIRCARSGSVSGSFVFAGLKLYPPFYQAKNKGLGTGATEPKMFDCLGGCRKSEKSTAIEPHEHLGTVRVGTLRDHESWGAAIRFDVDFRRRVAHGAEVSSH